jgi:signal transduction histidine kinase
MLGRSGRPTVIWVGRLVASLRAVRNHPLDVVLALALAVAALVELWLTEVDSRSAGDLVAVLLTTVPLMFRTVAPVATALATSSSLAVAVILGYPVDVYLLPWMAPLVAFFSVGQHADVKGMVVAEAGAVAALVAPVLANSPNASTDDVAIMVSATVVALAAGVAVRVLGLETDVLTARATRLELERDEAAEAAVAVERSRIARELHDVIGHSISVMGLQAGAVRRGLTPAKERERQMLLSVERLGRDAVAEMHGLIGLLRADDGDKPAAAVTLQQINDLAADMRNAGLSLELCVEGELADLSPGRALAAFRILQEALTNALRHGPDARVTATLRRGREAVEIVVVNVGGKSSDKPTHPGGYGLIGVRERALLYGGTFEAGRRPEGGFSVVARVPTAAQ